MDIQTPTDFDVVPTPALTLRKGISAGYWRLSVDNENGLYS